MLLFRSLDFYVFRRDLKLFFVSKSGKVSIREMLDDSVDISDVLSTLPVAGGSLVDTYHFSMCAVLFSNRVGVIICHRDEFVFNLTGYFVTFTMSTTAK